MKVAVALILLTGILVGNQFDFTNGVGSVTYETNNGFPTNFLGDIVNSDVVKRKLNSRWKWQVWDVVPGTHAYQIYVFNITNPDEVEKGGKPTLQQLGPYYYKEYRYKFDVSMNLDLSVNFVRNYTYTFDPRRSTGSETDLVTTINIPLVVFSTLAAKYSPSPSEANKAVAALVASGESLFKRKVKLEDLLFHGIDVSKYQKYLDLLGPETPLKQEFRDGFQSILKLKCDSRKCSQDLDSQPQWLMKNGVHEGQFTVDSGLKMESKVGSIIWYNGLSNLTYWDGDTCNKIQGTDGSVFPPNTQSSNSLQMLEVDLCRSISFDYAQDVQYKSVVGHLYSISNHVLEDPSASGGQECFCRKDQGNCLKKGVLDVSKCQFDAPYVMSYAHFLNASPEYQEAVRGLSPDPKLHRTQVTIEPVTGGVISFQKRYQWNIWIKPLAGIDYFQKYPSLLFPILWNDDIFNMDPDKEELLMEELARQAGGGGAAASSTSNSSVAVVSEYSKAFTILLFLIFGWFVLENN